jgi:SAM-dependent methyltransferase
MLGRCRAVAWSRTVEDELLARLARELASFRTPWEDPAHRASLVAGALPRIVATLDLLPPATRESRLLELGSDPFLGSQCLDLVWPGRVTHANYYGTADRRSSRTLVEVGGDRTKTYESDLFNVEIDEFPYPDETFDVVIFSELVEHLAINPVWALAEMHRVLKPGGHLLVSTPNALSLERLDAVVRGRRPSVDQYSPAFGYGARHNREYSADELQYLLDTGFDIEAFIARDLRRFPLGERLLRSALRVALRPFATTSRKEHLFLRARRRPVFRWRFSELLFTDAMPYRVARHPWVEMGVNDAIQCEGAWGPAEELSDGSWLRRVHGRCSALPGGSAILRGVAGRSRVRVDLRAEVPAADGETRMRIGVVSRAVPLELIGAMFRSDPPDGWVTVDIPLVRTVSDGEHLVVNVAVGPDQAVAVRRIALT